MTDPSFEIPIACSLSATDARTRKDDWKRLLERAAVTRTPLAGGGTRIALAPLDGVRAELRRLIEAERECCPFLEFELDDEGGALAVTIPALADA
ncbi:MAG TPA: hypothetical protein VGI67_22185 [Thermoleophilaceae bacterium]